MPVGLPKTKLEKVSALAVLHPTSLHSRDLLPRTSFSLVYNYDILMLGLPPEA